MTIDDKFTEGPYTNFTPRQLYERKTDDYYLLRLIRKGVVIFGSHDNNHWLSILEASVDRDISELCVIDDPDMYIEP